MNDQNPTLICSNSQGQAASINIISDADFIAAADLVEDAISERDFSKLQLIILGVILKLSFRRRRTKAYVSKLKFFAEFSRVSKGNVSTTLAWLKEQRVIAEHPSGCYGINVTVDDWRVPIRVRVRPLIEQYQLELEPEHLRDLLRECFVESAQNAISMRAAGASCGLVQDRVEGVPELGAPFGLDRSTALQAEALNHSPDACRGPAVFTPPGPARNGGVPDSGTGVPDSGTGVPDSGTPGPVSPLVPPFLNVKQVERSTFNALAVVPKSGTAAKAGNGRPKLTRDEERRLMELIREFIPEDMEHSGGFWRTRAVRNFPKEVEEMVGWGRYLSKTGHKWDKSKAAWLNAEIARAAGLASLGDVGPGARPTE